MREDYLGRHPGEKRLQGYASLSEQGFRLGGSHFQRLFDLEREPAQLREPMGLSLVSAACWQGDWSTQASASSKSHSI